MTTSALIVLILVLIALGVTAWLVYRQQRRKGLQKRFGPEYSHAVSQYGDESHAVDALAARERRMEKIQIRALSHEDQRLFIEKWQAVQRDFVERHQTVHT